MPSSRFNWGPVATSSQRVVHQASTRMPGQHLIPKCNSTIYQFESQLENKLDDELRAFAPVSLGSAVTPFRLPTKR